MAHRLASPAVIPMEVQWMVIERLLEECTLGQLVAAGRVSRGWRARVDFCRWLEGRVGCGGRLALDGGDAELMFLSHHVKCQ